MRVTNLEDALDALDKRTKFAQSLSMHGVLLPNVSWRQRYENPESIYNETGSSVTTYYGGTAANGHNTTIDPFVNAFISTDDSNNPLTQNGSGLYIRQDSRFALAYQITDKLDDLAARAHPELRVRQPGHELAEDRHRARG